MEGTIAEIRMFAGNFAPRSWFFCQGQILSIAQNTAFFSLLGTTFGGNGQTTFAIPDFRGRVALGTGQGPGLPSVQLGEMAGTPTTTLTINQIPAHNHTATGVVNLQVNNDAAGLTNNAANSRFGASGAIFTAATDELVPMAPAQTAITVNPNGGSQPFSIMPPYLGMNYIICSEGIFPSRN